MTSTPFRATVTTLVIVAILSSVAIAIAQTTYNTVVVTNAGQFVNARLSDNIYIDMATSPPTLRAFRPIVNVSPVVQPDGTWLIPVPVPATAQLQVYVNGLLEKEEQGYKRDAASTEKLIPWAHKENRQVEWKFGTGELYTVLVTIHR